MAEADGSVRLDVDLTINKAEKKLGLLNQKIEQKQKQLNKNIDRKNTLGIDFNETGAKLDEAIAKVKYLKEKVASSSGDTKSLYKEELSEAVEEQRILTKETNRIGSEYERVNNQIETGKEKIAEMQEQAGLLQRTIDEKRPAEEMKARITSLKGGFKGIMKYALGIRTVFALVNRLRSAIKEAFNAYASEDPVMKKQMTELKASLAQLKLSWGAAFAPIVSAVIPILQKLISWGTSAANVVARLISIITGKSTYKKAIANANELAGSVGGVGDAAKEAKKQLMGFDELNILEGNKTSGGGGGGGFAGADLIEEATNAGDGSFVAKLGMTIKDFIFDWGDWDAEKIYRKAIDLLPALHGFKAGWQTGGLKGAVFGGICGLIFGLGNDALQIDPDGKLTAEEVIRSIIPTILFKGFTSAGHPIIGLSVSLLFSWLLGKDAEKGEDSVVHQVVERFKMKFDEFLSNANPDSPFSVGAAIVGGIISGIFSGVGLLEKKLVEWVNEHIINPIKEKLGIHSPSTVFAEIGENIVEGLKDGIQEKWLSFTTNFATKFENLKQMLGGIVDKIKNLFNFQFNIPQIKLPHLQVAWESIDGSTLARFLGITALPHLSVSWYAKGGIVDKATLFGAGEAGAEAIVPLERNTQWIDMVASGIMKRLPAMANGTVVPPGSLYGGSGNQIGNLLNEIKALRDDIYSLASQPIEVNNRMYIDKRQIGESVTEYQRDITRSRGR